MSAGTRKHKVTIAVMLGAFLLAACSQSPSSADGTFVTQDGKLTEVAPTARQPAPEIEGVDLFGEPISLRSLRGQVVVLNVWGSWCPPCREEQPILSKVSEDLAPQGVQFLGIAVREPASASRSFVENRKVPYPSISDSGGKILVGFSSSLPTIAVPSTYVVDRQGRVAARLMDVATDTTLTALIDRVLDEN